MGAEGRNVEIWVVNHAIGGCGEFLILLARMVWRKNNMAGLQVGFLNLPSWQEFLRSQLTKHSLFHLLSAPVLGKEDLESPWISLSENEFFSIVQIGMHFGHPFSSVRFPKHVISNDSKFVVKRLLQDTCFETGIRGAIGGTFPMVNLCGDESYLSEPRRLLSMTDGVSTFIFSKMDRGITFEEATREAQWEGLASENPVNHVHGLIARDRLALLASHIFRAYILPSSIFTEGFGKIQPQDVKIASFFHYKIRFLGVVERKENGIEAWLRPCLIPNRYFLAQARGGMESAYLICRDKTPVLYTGPGSTKETVLRGMLQDLHIFCRQKNFGHPAFSAIPILPQDEMKNRFYLRILLMNFTDTLSIVVRIFSEGGVGIRLLTQSPLSLGQNVVAPKGDSTDLVIFTEPVCEKILKNSLKKLHEEVKLSTVQCCLNYES